MAHERPGLTILAYRYEGLRMTDFKTTLRALKEQMEEEQSGPYHVRPACRTFVRWVALAGGSVRGVRRASGASGESRGPGYLRRYCIISWVETDVSSIPDTLRFLRSRAGFGLDDVRFGYTVQGVVWMMLDPGCRVLSKTIPHDALCVFFGLALCG